MRGVAFPFWVLKKEIGTALCAETVVWPAAVAYQVHAVAAPRRQAGGPGWRGREQAEICTPCGVTRWGLAPVNSLEGERADADVAGAAIGGGERGGLLALVADRCGRVDAPGAV